MGEQLRAQVLATVLWLFLAALGLIVVLQVHEAVRVTSVIVIPIDPMQTVASQGKITLVSRVMLIILAATWLVGVILLLNYFFRIVKKSVGYLAIRFLVIAALELALVGMATLAIRRLPGLVL